MRYGYEGKCFAFIHLHKTKTTCFGTDLVYTATRNDTLSQTKQLVLLSLIISLSCDMLHHLYVCDTHIPSL